MFSGRTLGFYLTHFAPGYGKGRSISRNLYVKIDNTDLINNLKIMETDGTTM